MSEELLQRMGAQGGSLEEKIEEVISVFRSSARHLESLQQVLRNEDVRLKHLLTYIYVISSYISNILM